MHPAVMNANSLVVRVPVQRAVMMGRAFLDLQRAVMNRELRA